MIAQDPKRVSLFYISLFVCMYLFIQASYTIFSGYGIQILNNIFIFIILAVSYNLINGVAGQLSLEPNGFVAIGAYTTSLLLLSKESKLDMFQLEDPSPLILAINTDFIPALLISGTFAAIIALFLSFPVFRVRGDYLAIVTLGFGLIIKIIAVNNPSITNGAIGLNDIPNITNLYWSGFIALISVIIIFHIVYSKYGRAMKALRDDEDAAIAMGVNTFTMKTIAFTTSAFLEGVGGGLLAALLTTVSPEQFSFELTFMLLIIIVLGGLGSTTGAILGAILVMGGGEWLRFLDRDLVIFGEELGAHPGLRMVVFSIILLSVMLFAREGLLGKREIWEFVRFKKR